MMMYLTKIRFSKKSPEDKDLPPNIFDDIAQEAAEYISKDKEKNKSTQIRRFYDELVMWHDKVYSVPQDARQKKYEELAPFIKMLNAKVAYAFGRKLVDEAFGKLFDHCIKEVKDPKSLKYCKLFMEALIGFRKAKE